MRELVVRESRSASTTRMAPPTNDAGSRCRPRGPTSGRKACGATSPTNGTDPATAVHEPATSADRPRIVKRVRVTGSPSAAASSVPSESTSSGRESRPSSTLPERMNEAPSCRWVAPRPSSPPASQKMTVFTRNSSVATSSTDVPAPASAETASPVSSSPCRDGRPTACASAYTASTAAIAPANAASVSARNTSLAQPSRTASTAPSAAPPVTPRRPESAMGLRNTDCKDAPTTARPPPTSAASRTRGRRTVQRIVSPTGSRPVAPRPSAARSDEPTPFRGRGTLPMVTPPAMHTGSSAHSATKARRWRFSSLMDAAPARARDGGDGPGPSTP